MMKFKIKGPFQLILIFLFSPLMGCLTPSMDQPKLRTVLNDQQVLVGELKTRKFTLETDLGTFDFDTRDAGEMGPLKEADMEKSKGKIRLWLRNGSEFVGSWKEPSARMTLQIGKKEIEANVPIGKIKRLQFQGDPVWQQEVHRVRTKSGDDFFVDASKTQIRFKSEFADLQPYLTEINYLKPIDKEKKKWRIHFINGTVINAAMEDTVNFFLIMGPKTIEISKDKIEWIERQRIYRQELPKNRLGRGMSPASDSFYSNQSQKKAKEQANDVQNSWRRK